MKKTLLSYTYLSLCALIPFQVLANETIASQTQIMAQQAPQETVQNTKTSIPDIKGNPIVLSWDELKKHEENKEKLPEDFWNDFTTFTKKY